MAEIDADLDRAVPMQRLLQGDVGSGKTVVALHALLACGRGRAPGCAHGADRDARRAALPHHRRAVRTARRPRHAADELAAREGARRRAAAHRIGRRPDRRRDARAHREGGRLLRPRGRGRRRAAPLRRRAADGARRGAQPARAPPDRDADPADARAHGLRRPRGRASSRFRPPTASRSSRRG